MYEMRKRERKEEREKINKVCEIHKQLNALPPHKKKKIKKILWIHSWS